MIGRMDRKITFQTRTEQTSGLSNEKKDVWTDYVTVWAEMLPARGTTKEQAGQMIDVGEDVYRIWYRDDITHDMRVVHNGVNKAITSMEEFGRRNKLIVRTQRIY